MNAFATLAVAVPITKQISAIEAEIAATRARMTARMGDPAFKQNQDADHLEALRAAAATLRLAITRTGAHSA